MKLTEVANILGAHVEGADLLARCPVHDDTHASLVIGVSDAGKLLFTCRAGCLSSDVARAIPSSIPFSGIENDMIDDVPSAGKGVDKPVTGAPLAQVKAQVQQWTSADIPSEAYTYARERFGIDRATFAALGLGYISDDEDYPKGSIFSLELTAVPRLLVPFRNASGVLHGFQARDISEDQTAKAKWCGPSNPKNDEGQRTGETWGRTAWFDGGTGMPFLVVSEGPGDALTAASVGFDSVGIRGVSHATAVVDEIAENHQNRTVVLAGDNDKAGERMNSQLGQALLDRGIPVTVVELPGDVDDISDWYVKHSSSFKDDFQRAVTSGEAVTPSAPSDHQTDPNRLTSHVDVAREVVGRFPGLQWVNGIGFLIYTGGVWTSDQRQAVRRKVHEISDELEAEGQALSTEGKSGADELLAASRRLRSTPFINHVVQELAAMVEASLDDFDQDPYLLAVNNGVIDLRTGELLPHSMSFKLTKLLEIDYDPNAAAPRWEQFLSEIMLNDADMVAYLHRLIGYGITGSTKEQCFTVLYGTGANGKSVFTDTLADVFEAITRTTPFSTFEERPGGGIPNDLAALRGARLVMASEGERGKPMAEAVLKRVTGQDLIVARFMREEFFSFHPTFLIMLATNHKPAFKGQDEGLWRRVKLIPFKAYFSPEDRDQTLTETLKSEAQGILTLAVKGAVDWYNNGLGDPELVRSATSNYRAVADALAGFFPDGPLSRGTTMDFVRGPEAYKAYEAWAESEDLPLKERWSRRAFYGALEERGIERLKHPDHGIVLMGVKLVEPEFTPSTKPFGREI